MSKPTIPSSSSIEEETTFDDMRAEYDFSGGVRGKHYKNMREGFPIKIHEPDTNQESAQSAFTLNRVRV